MKIKSKLIVCIIGILIGLALIYVGFTVRGGSYDMVSTSSIGQPNEFCNKYEDEMYNATQDVGHAVNNTTRAVNESVKALANVCDAIGWLIIALGATDACFFTYKLCAEFKKNKQA